jgi:glycosyltransferase involved in cell wall biosynthesis
MNITALYKIFRGPEFLRESIASIYNHVDNILFVSSDIGWDGTTGNNTLEVVKNYNDPLLKIWVEGFNTRLQGAQYDFGINYIRENFRADWVLLIDSDEVWDETSWESAIDELGSAPDCVNGYTASMYTYIKSPLYRIEDKGRRQVRPRIFVRSNVDNIGIRGSGVAPVRYMPGVNIHHFALVRDSIEEVFRKMKTSHVGDKHPLSLVDLDKWKREVWDLIPGPAYHYYDGCQAIWEKTIEISIEQLPEAVKNTLKQRELVNG